MTNENENVSKAAVFRRLTCYVFSFCIVKKIVFTTWAIQRGVARIPLWVVHVQPSGIADLTRCQEKLTFLQVGHILNVFPEFYPVHAFAMFAALDALSSGPCENFEKNAGY